MFGPEEMQRALEQYFAWTRKPFVKGHEHLAEDMGKVIRSRGGVPRVGDGPYSETKEVLAGFFIIEAADYDEAVARSLPRRAGDALLRTRAAIPEAQTRRVSLTHGGILRVAPADIPLLASAMPPYLTAEEYARLPEDKLYRDELIRGTVSVRSPGPGFPHGIVDANISHLLLAFVIPRQLGHVVHNSGFVLERNPDTVCSPDVSFVSASRVPGHLDRPYLDGAPDLAVEVLSPGNTKKDTAWHVDIYLRTGSRLVWVVDRKRRSVTVHRPNREAETLSADDSLSGEDVLPGFACRVADFFDLGALAG